MVEVRGLRVGVSTEFLRDFTRARGLETPLDINIKPVFIDFTG
jgi:hypothetical protein